METTSTLMAGIKSSQTSTATIQPPQMIRNFKEEDFFPPVSFGTVMENKYQSHQLNMKLSQSLTQKKLHVGEDGLLCTGSSISSDEQDNQHKSMSEKAITLAISNNIKRQAKVVRQLQGMGKASKHNTVIQVKEVKMESDLKENHKENEADSDVEIFELKSPMSKGDASEDAEIQIERLDQLSRNKLIQQKSKIWDTFYNESNKVI